MKRFDINSPLAQRAIVVLAVMILAMIYFGPVKNNKKATEAAQIQTTTITTANTAQEANLTTLRLQLSGNGKALIRALRAALPSKLRADYELTRISRLARLSKTDLVKFDFVKSATSAGSTGVNPGYQPYDFNIELRASTYLPMMRFINGLQSQAQLKGKNKQPVLTGPIYKINKVNLSALAGVDPTTGAPSKKKTYTLTLNGQSFSKGDAPVPPPVATPPPTPPAS